MSLDRHVVIQGLTCRLGGHLWVSMCWDRPWWDLLGLLRAGVSRVRDEHRLALHSP